MKRGEGWEGRGGAAGPDGPRSPPATHGPRVFIYEVKGASDAPTTKFILHGLFPSSLILSLARSRSLSLYLSPSLKLWNKLSQLLPALIF